MNNPISHKSMIFEESILAGLMIDNSHWLAVKERVNEDDFFHPHHRLIYKTIERQLQANKPTDIVTLSQFKDMEVPYLAQIIERLPTTENTVSYAEQLREYAERYRLTERLKQTIEDLTNGETNQHEALQDLINHQEKITTHKRSNGFMFTEIDNIKIKPLDWLIEDFVEANSLTEVFGAPESGKSLLAIDWGMSVAAGIAWQGHRTKQGAVFYIAGEGHNGLSRRFGAWRMDNNIHGKLPFYPSQQAAALYDLHSAISVERAINQIVQKDKVEPRLIIIDTLARNFGGGNENSTEDMSLFVAHIDRHLRERFNATVLLVHHTGHGSAERGRGSSALRAAVDTEYSMIKNDADIINLTCTKMKDAAHPLPKSFQIRAVELNIADEKGNPANGPVLIETTYSPPKEKTSALRKNEKLGLSSLAILFEEERERLEDIGKNPDDAKVTVSDWQERLDLGTRFYDVKKSLPEKGLIAIEKGFVYLLENGEE